MMKVLAHVLSLTLLCACSAAAADTNTPDALVKSVVGEVLGVIKKNKDRRTLRQLAEEKVVPYFDFKQMTQVAAGKAWRTATPEQKRALESGFRTLLVNTYTASLSRSSAEGKTVEVKPLAHPDAKDEALVKTLVKESGRPPVAIDYRMANSAGGWKVVDVTIENVSLVTNYRTSFAEEISRSGVDGLIKSLNAKNAAATNG